MVIRKKILKNLRNWRKNYPKKVTIFAAIISVALTSGNKKFFDQLHN